MYWANFLHIYQPPTQKAYWIKKIANESYRKLTKGLLAHPRAKLTLNVNAVLTELLEQHGCEDVIRDLRTLAERKQIEFTGSAKYHPFLPLMPEKEIQRQIELNTETNKKYFGDAFAPRGFFPPEMAYADKVAKVARRMGFEWLILDELAYNGTLHAIDWANTYTIKGVEGMRVYFRERDTSFRILSAEVGMSVFSGPMLVRLLGDRVKKHEYLITAMDGETFGHHRPGLEHLLFDLYEVPDLTPVCISDLPKLFPGTKQVAPRPSSWALMMRDIENNTPYARWDDPDNEIQRMQWRLTNLALQQVEKIKPSHPKYKKIRIALDRSLHSDQYWWASAQPWWSIEMIEAGAKELRDVVLASPSATQKDRDAAEKLYRDILYTSFDWQRTGKVDDRSKSSDEDVTQRITKEAMYIPKKEFDGMIQNLTTQMETAAQTKEYERAAQLRDRIGELKEKEHEITKR
ncbi:MAG: hypothetical protein A2898_05365 [Candidatus Kerfeldbacteria bacterium RIFCSPLOWO2_01_FULL_48_11]|uniref:UVR domain-containing protein n=1 Tax=Candidatus Kerfeldbacteria bacterium RIFCSPLOWO2_01_FULL_48_11 TaxID=1798543 RepID=A0A1G2AZS8_9BACT|nr:MAG: hypothetical protein UY34_C0003G0017 [Parcubacteria group bacterium GW2011_GWA2_48_9]KKW16704.1 MAG: hypothetical protein UY52_C0001G0024 [Parcubacteria group bacterium GW2011_GWC2_49_9]OGY82433.1 MAG: hypothetical protein A2898_05365 [Candidatus Kerfeldbacteria bacterium RIFCSPLOWO2_01_FULL_48_11]HCJ52313.1 hypothetical protein [Candidatus Kerfeldbacteria bacterium]HCM67529.1 hypothetical protein [Candidatus Kerfeldbacteria bacterium]